MKKKIKQALISVSDKSNLKSILKILKKYKIRIISSGGTYKKIKKMGYYCREISEFTKKNNLILHVDAVQCVGKIPIDFAALNVHCMSISAHKLGGPAGVGALIIKEGLDLSSLLGGGGQENSYRPGTQNTLGIIGFGAAAEAASSKQSTA